MSFDADRLYELLPAVYRIRDADQGEPLRALLSVIAEQVGVLEADLDQLYDDQFIETCAEWVTAYIGDLIGYRPLHGVVPSISSPRAEVANTIGFRRRKGTAAVLEQLARDVSGWNARVVEFFQLLATTQFMNHIRPNHSYAPNLREWELLERLDTPFDRVAHTVDVRRIANREGLYNIPNVGIFLWRLNAFSLTDSPASTVDAQRHLFSPLGNNTPLFTRPETEDEITHLAEPINVPEPISRRVLHEFLDDYYGPGKSILLAVDGLEKPADEVKACDLSDLDDGSWAHMPPANDKIAIDPVLGRIALPADQTPSSVKVTFHYGFSAEVGGGEYERAASFESLEAPDETITSPGLIQDALNNLPDGGVAQITDSGRYEETLSIALNAGGKLELRAANEHRPTLVLGGDLQITGGDDAEVTLNGLLIIGGKIVVLESAMLRRLTLRHCTLVPGLSLDIEGEPPSVPEPSLVIDPSGVTIEIDRCIVGPLAIAEGSGVQITDSIVDATAQDEIAFAGPPSVGQVGGTLKIDSSTVIGRIHTAEMTLVSNSILLAAPQAGDPTPPIRSDRKQAGCVRFSYLPENARVPRRYRTQPDLAIKTALEEALKQNPELTADQKDQIDRETRTRVRPIFSDLHYGQPDYAQLDSATAAEIRTGADDESEMGAFHHLFAPQRETNINVRLDEYLRFGLEAGIFFET